MTDNISDKINKNNIILLGFMGSGKTTIGQILSKKLNATFLDTDSIIEQIEGKSIQEIFSNNGEHFFRQKEKEVLSSLLPYQNTIISTGGGLPCNSTNMRIIHSLGTSFYLKVGISTLTNRLYHDQTRPLITQFRFKKDLKSFIKYKIAERSRFYEQADFIIRAGTSPEKIANSIINLR